MTNESWREKFKLEDNEALAEELKLLRSEKNKFYKEIYILEEKQLEIREEQRRRRIETDNNDSILNIVPDEGV